MASALSSSSLMALRVSPKRVESSHAKVSAQATASPRARREHARARPDPRNAGGDLARGNAEPERADGEIVPAHGEHERAEQPGDERARQRRGGKADAKTGQELRLVEQEGCAAALCVGIGADIVEQPDLDDGRDIHADADEQHVAKRVVAHLPADQIPGEREHDEQQKLGRLRLVGRRDQRHDHNQQHDPHDEQEATGPRGTTRRDGERVLHGGLF